MAVKIVGYYTAAGNVEGDVDRWKFPLNLQGISQALNTLERKHPEKQFQYGGCPFHLINGVLVGVYVSGEPQQSSLVFVSERENGSRLKKIIEEDLGLPLPDESFFSH